MIVNKTPFKIVATILAKNEEDIIGANIEHHLNHGISQFIITDNNSTDKTKHIISKYPEVIEVIDEYGDDHNQSIWVSKMARLACKLNPDWIVHLDADELWCGLPNLKNITAKKIGSVGMYLHPPILNATSLEDLNFYLDFDHIKELPGETKVAHRPDPNIIITHGNHGFGNNQEIFYTKNIWRHHYPVRNYKQFLQKTILGHLALSKRNAICERWKKWYELYEKNELKNLYDTICASWQNYIQNFDKESFQNLIKFWATEDVIKFFQNTNFLPQVGQWPKIKKID